MNLEELEGANKIPANALKSFPFSLHSKGHVFLLSLESFMPGKR